MTPTLADQIAAVEQEIENLRSRVARGYLVQDGRRLNDDIPVLTAALATLRRSQWLVEALREVDKYSLVISSAVARCDFTHDAEITAMIRKARVALLPFADIADPPTGET